MTSNAQTCPKCKRGGCETRPLSSLGTYIHCKSCDDGEAPPYFHIPVIYGGQLKIIDDYRIPPGRWLFRDGT